MASTKQPTRSSRHRRYRSIPPDPIDVLDKSSPAGVYHHGGPYDATLLSRNLNPKYSPLAAVRDSNMAALEATPREFVDDALTKHVPLQGTATVPPGHRDLGGAVMRYEDGTDMMREEGRDGGAYKRWPGLSYHPDDLKGKGEPSYSLEEAEKARRLRKLGTTSTGTDDSYELHPLNARKSSDHSGRPTIVGTRKRSASDVPRHTGSSFLSEGKKGLRQRLGSLRRGGS